MRPISTEEAEAHWFDTCEHDGPYVDMYSPWGGSGDQEPPEPVALCRRCERSVYWRTLAYCIEHGIPAYAERSYWVPPEAWRLARSVARGLSKHGIELDTHHRRVRDTYRSRGETYERREWCACGFDTGWLGRDERGVSMFQPSPLMQAHGKNPWMDVSVLRRRLAREYADATGVTA